MDPNSVFTALGHISTLGKLIIDERDRQKLSALKSELQSKIIEAQKQFFEVTTQLAEQQRLIADLEKKNRVLEDLFNLRDSYELVLLSKEQGFYAYRYTQNDETEHYICQTCFDAKNLKQVLRIREDQFCMCPACGQSEGVWLSNAKRPSVASVRSRRERGAF